MFPNSVTFVEASYSTGVRAGVRPAFAGGLTLSAYVEEGAQQRDETDTMYGSSRPIARTAWKIFTQTDPGATLGRTLGTDDLAIWNDGGLTMQIQGPAKRQGNRWLTEAEQVGSFSAAASPPPDDGFLLLDDGTEGVLLDA